MKDYAYQVLTGHLKEAKSAAKEMMRAALEPEYRLRPSFGCYDGCPQYQVFVEGMTARDAYKQHVFVVYARNKAHAKIVATHLFAINEPDCNRIIDMEVHRYRGEE